MKRTIDIGTVWNGVKLSLCPESRVDAREFGWTDGESPRPPDLLFAPLADLITRAERSGITVRLRIEGQRVEDLRRAYAMRGLAVCGWV